MGLLTVLKKLREKEKEMRILVLGLDNAGKTTLLRRFAGKETSVAGPTFGFEIQTLGYRGYKLNFWDVGGQKSLRSYWRNYFDNTDGMVWVIDSTDTMRLEDCKKELHKLLNDELLIGSTLLFLANKQDLSGALSVESIVNFLQLKQVKGHHWCCLPCSAVSGENLLNAIDWLVSDVASRVFTLE